MELFGYTFQYEQATNPDELCWSSTNQGNRHNRIFSLERVVAPKGLTAYALFSGKHKIVWIKNSQSITKTNEAKMTITTPEQYKAAQSELEALGMEFAQGNDVLDESGVREQELTQAMDESPFEFNMDTGKVQNKGDYEKESNKG